MSVKKPRYQSVGAKSMYAAILQGYACQRYLTKQKATDQRKRNEVIIKFCQQSKCKYNQLKNVLRLIDQYQEQELIDICNLIEQHDSRFAISSFQRLLAIQSKTKRHKVLTQAIKKQWSYDRIHREILAKKTRRGGVGRKPKVPDKSNQVIPEIISQCIHWCRWADAMEQWHDELSQEVVTKLIRITRMIRQLETKCEELCQKS